MRTVLQSIEVKMPPIKGSAKAVVVLSGGQDSVTVLAAAAMRWHQPEDVFAISFDYGQRHAVELRSAKAAATYFGIKEHVVVDLKGPLSLAQSALTGQGGESVNDDHKLLPGRPASFVPNRNAMMLTVAHAYAQQVGAAYVYTGANATDYSGYPDCRPEFLRSLQHALMLGSEQPIQIVAPLLDVTKAETFALADELGVLDYVKEYTHTCYNGEREMHPHGYGCGHCPACLLRAQGFNTFALAMRAAGGA